MTELEAYRNQIDEIDAQLTSLFLKRMEITGQVGAYKAARGLAVLDPEREKAVIAAKAALARDPARKSDVAALYETIMGLSRRQQRQIVREEDSACAACWRAVAEARQPVVQPRIVYQGEPGAYSEEAAVGLFGLEADRRGCPWFEDVFQALERGDADYAVLPMENSSTGSIRQVYDLLAQYDYYIVGEYQIKVEHCLVALPGVTLEEIQTVYSHEQGLMQCKTFLDSRNWRQIPALDTAGAARQLAASGDRTAAAICARRAAELYGLHILKESVNYNQENYTRFVVVSPVMEMPESRDKISAIFHLPHQSGSLHEILTVFAVHGLNLLKVESRPIPGQGWEYLFFLDFTGDLAAPGMDGVVRELSQLSSGFRVLGNFRAYGG